MGKKLCDKKIYDIPLQRHLKETLLSNGMHFSNYLINTSLDNKDLYDALLTILYSLYCMKSPFNNPIKKADTFFILKDTFCIWRDSTSRYVY